MESIGEPFVRSPSLSSSCSTQKSKHKPCAEITLKQFLDFLKTAYQVEGTIEGTLLANGMTEAVNWLKVQNNELVKSIQCQTSATKLKAIEDHREPLRKKSEVFLTESDPIKVKLTEIMNEGLLDSVLPYFVPSQTSRKGSLAKLSDKSSSQSLPPPVPSQSNESVKSKKSDVSTKFSCTLLIKTDSEVDIHVFDEIKNARKDFVCNQKLLLDKMGYFATVTEERRLVTGQTLDDMEISVHCDVDVFDWLMRWVKRESLLEEDRPQLNPQEVIQILVSANYLQMEPLVEECLLYCHEHMNDILRLNVTMISMSDTLLTRLAAMYTNTEVEAIRDRRDKIQSKLFCKLILSLAEPEPESVRGHWCSLARVYQCSKCQQHISPSVSQKIPCIPSAMQLQYDGSIISYHVRDPSWNINEYILKLYKELKTWRKVYWRLWGNAHFLYCLACKRYFPVHQIGWCRYHPDPPQFFTLDTQKAPLPVGRYPCCGERAYRFQILHNHSGCQFREHTVCTKNVRDSAILTMLENYRHLIEEEPPELMFPEKLTRLVARDPTSNDKKLSCKEVFWWDGLEIVPPRPKMGLLSMFADRQHNKLPEPPSSEDSSIENDSDNGSTCSSTSSSSPSSEGSSPSTSTKKPEVKKHFMRRKKLNRLWQHNLSARSNQDIQRAYEETVLKRMTNLLDRKTSDGTLKLGRGISKNMTPFGGIWVRLEAEFNHTRSASSSTANVLCQPKVRNIFTGKIKAPSKAPLK